MNLKRAEWPTISSKGPAIAIAIAAAAELTFVAGLNPAYVIIFARIGRLLLPGTIKSAETRDLLFKLAPPGLTVAHLFGIVFVPSLSPHRRYFSPLSSPRNVLSILSPIADDDASFSISANCPFDTTGRSVVFLIDCCDLRGAG